MEPTLTGVVVPEDGEVKETYGVVIPEFLQQAPFSDIGLNRAAAVSALASMRYENTGEDFDTSYERHKTLLSEGGEGELRNKIGVLKAERTTALTAQEAFENLIPSEEARQLIESTFGSVDPYALEEGAIDELIDLGLTDPTQAEVSVREDFEGSIRDQAIKLEILQGELDKIDTELNAQGTLAKIGNFLGSMVPFNQTVRDLGKGNFTLMSGEAVLNRREELLRLPLPEFKQAVQDYVSWLKEDGIVLGDNPLLNKQAIENLIDFGQEDTGTHTFWTLFDAADVGLVGVGAGAAASKALFRKSVAASSNPLRTMADVNRVMSTDTAVGRVMAAQNGTPTQGTFSSTHNALDVMLPSYATGTLDPSIGLSGDVLRTLEANQRAMADVLGNSQTQRLAPEEIQQAFLDFRNAHMRRYKANEIKDVIYHTQDDVTGMHKASVVFGKANGVGGFKNELAATKSAEKRGLANFDVIQNSDGQFYIRQIHNIPEEGMITPYQTEAIKDYGIFSQAKNPHVWIEKRLSQDMMLADGRKAVLTKTINDTVVRNLGKLKKRELENLNTVLAKGMEYKHVDAEGRNLEGKWFTVEELKNEYERAFNRLPTDREVAAYYSTKQLNDFDYVIRNRAVYNTLARAGYEFGEVSKIGYKGNVKVLNDYTNAVRDRILNVSDDIFYDGDITKEFLDEKVAQGYKLVRVQDPVYRPEGKYNVPVNLLLVKRGDMRTGALDPIQLSYRAGGHRLYAPSQKFVKQANVITTGSGSKMLLNPIVHAASESDNVLRGWVDRHNHALEVVREYKAIRNGKTGNLNAAEARMVDALEDINVNDIDHWDELVANGQINEDTPFEITLDGDEPLFGRAEAASLRDMRDVDLPLDDTARYITHTNRKYTGKRGGRLIGPDDELVKVIDPLETADMAINNAIRTGAYYDFRATQIEAWAQSARPYIGNAQSDSFQMVFNNPQWVDNIDPKFRAKLEAQRSVIQRTLNMRTSGDIAFDARKQGIADWVEKRTKGRVTQAKAREALDVVSNDSVQALRSMAYDLYLGLFNVGQAIVQTQTTAAIAMISPKNGLASVRAYPAIRFALGKSDEAVEQLTKTHANLISASGYTPEQFKQMMKLYNESGFGLVNESFSMMGDVTPSTRTGALGKARQKGRIILNESERMNSSVAYSTAFKEYVEQFPKTKFDDAAKRWILDRANALNMDMRHHAKTALQEGPQAIAAQFSQYPIHMLQNMFGKNTRLSREEQMRLFIGSVVAYGGAAVPFGTDIANELAEMYTEATGQPMNETAYKQITSGAFDSLLYSISGGELNTDFGGRVGVGGWAEQMADLWTNHSILELVGGAGSPAFTGLAKKIFDNARFISTSVMSGNLTTEDISVAAQDIARSASSYSSTERAIMMGLLGVELSKQGAYVDNDRDVKEAIATFLGIPLAEVSMTYDMYGSQEDRNKTVNTVVKSIMENNMRALVSDDEKVRTSYAKRTATILKAIESDPMLHSDVLDAVARRTPRSFYDEMVIETIRDNPNDPRANFAIETNKKVSEQDGVQ